MRRTNLFCLICCTMPTVWALPEDRAQPIHLEANSGLLDQRTGVSTYEGNVAISQGSLRLNADRVTIYVKNNHFHRMEASGQPARLRYKATADKPELLGESAQLEYDVAKAKVIMRGGARLTQGQDTFVGEQVEYDLNADQVRARGAGERGRIQFTLSPATASARQKP